MTCFFCIYETVWYDGKQKKGKHMKNLLKYMKGYEWQSILAPLFKLLEAFFDLLVPLFVANIINRGITEENYGYIIGQFGILILLALIGLVCSITAQYFAARASVGFSTKLRQSLFDHIQHLSSAQLEKVGTATLITRITSDVNQVQNGINMALRLLLRSPFIVFGAMIMAFTIDVPSALIFAGVIPILLVVVFFIMLMSIPMFKRVQQKLDDVLHLTRQNLTGVRVIRAFCREKEAVAEFDKDNNALLKLNEKVGLLSAFMNPLTYAIINIATILLIQNGALRVSAGALSQGDVVALYNYMAQIVVELIKLASLIITIDKSLACAGRVSAILKMEEEMHYGREENKQDETVAIAFAHVTFTYEGSSAPSLEDISFTLDKGKTLGIIGGTGSGKSTLAALIMRYYDRDTGDIQLFGRDIKDYTEPFLHKLCAIVPQHAVLFHGTIRDNLCFGNEKADDAEIYAALDIAQAREVVEGKAGKLDFVVEQNGSNLSGGQKQRLTIARALVAKSDIVILDDSSSALDFATDAALRKALRTLDSTTVIISQRASAVMHADEILVLDDGKLVGKGTHDSLLSTCEVYQEIVASQFREKEVCHA